MSDNAKRLTEIEQRHARIIGGRWEWSDCFNPESDDCGMVQVRIPSDRAWDADGWFYLFIADMEWATAADMDTAEFIANAPQDVDWLIDRVHELEDHLARLTQTSGYSTQYPEPPQANVCVFCNDGPCTLLCEPPADEREYLRQFRDGAFDEALAGYVTVDTGDPISIDLPIHKHFTFGRLFERLLEDGKRNG